MLLLPQKNYFFLFLKKSPLVFSTGTGSKDYALIRYASGLMQNLCLIQCGSQNLLKSRKN
ncbi:MAG: hypothetical protein DRN37_11070 [Thermoplasmata archaeon]|nr:MAG: hypothetical protein DRN37_11070 [Thermoplasmata archaeon]